MPRMAIPPVPTRIFPGVQRSLCITYLVRTGAGGPDLVGEPEGSPRLPSDERPKVLVPIPDDPAGMPQDGLFEPDTETLRLGAGVVRPVPASTWAFEVSGLKVVQRWIKRRVREPEGTRSSPLDDINQETWTTELTTELLDLLNVVGRLVSMEDRQADLLDRILAQPLLTVEELEASGIFPVAAEARKATPAPKVGAADTLFADG